MLFINRTGIFLSVMTYFFVTKQVDAKYVFVLSSFYAILRQSLTVYLPFAIQNFSETRVAIERIKQFLISDTQTPVTETSPEKQQLLKSDITIDEIDTKDQKKIGVYLKNVSVKWIQSEPVYSLKNVNFEAWEDELVIICGSVGGGKSTLLYTILNELSPNEGQLSSTGNLSFASQEPWLFSGTVQQNILFGSKFNKNKYNTIIKMCQLEDDLLTFRDGDNTLVGENGALLSGGQKMRIGLARALYKDADIYLLDDPFASIDIRIGNKIFQEGIMTYLKRKCVILVTNHLVYLAAADRIYNVEKGIVTVRENVYKKSEVFENESLSDENQIHVNNINLQKIKSKEEKQGSVNKQVYEKYAKASGSCFNHCLLFLMFLVSQVAASGADFIVAFW